MLRIIIIHIFNVLKMYWQKKEMSFYAIRTRKFLLLPLQFNIEHFVVPYFICLQSSVEAVIRLC